MEGSKVQLLNGFMEGANNRYVIPVYQRKYDWKIENCKQLYDDLVRVIKDNRPSHFFGSIVSDVIAKGGIIEFHIIDGQQRLTTVSLLLLAVVNLVKENKLHSQYGSLDEQIMERFLISKWAPEDNKIKLRPAKSDREALMKLFETADDYDRSSNLTINYQYFYDRLLNEEISVDEMFSAIGKLEVISITLSDGDNAQMIFESLNSTGRGLEEGDKIRNYVLMGLKPNVQNKLYKDYWEKIESCTMNQLSDFFRDFLTIKLQSTPTINNVYPVFKQYVMESQIPTEELLQDILKYARYYERFLTCKAGVDSLPLDDCLYRLKRLEITVTRPFLMEVFRLNHDGKISNEDLLQVFLVTESYLFRRNICDVPPNSLNKIFATINKEVIRFDNTAEDYLNKYIFVLESKKDSGRFPNDSEFAVALANKQIYLMRGRYKAYLFERLENYKTVETKDVYTHLDNNVYSIEHIMPQHLTYEWQNELGSDYETIHNEWVNRLANLTLTGYNPSLSNKTFAEKRDSENGGYKASGIRMNQRIAQLNKWGVEELIQRNDEMVKRAKEIWSFPETSFVPVEKEYDSCTLDDEDVDLTGREILKYAYKNAEQPCDSWTDMMEAVVSSLHQQDKSVLTSIAYEGPSFNDLGNYIKNNPELLRSPLKIDENIYIEKNTSTAYKMIILRRLFGLYHADPMDLVFYLKDVLGNGNADAQQNNTSKTKRMLLAEKAIKWASENDFFDFNPKFYNPGYIRCKSDYSGFQAHPGRSSAQSDRASARLIRSGLQPMLAADQHTC